jgi:hypothetical protein
MRKRKIMLFEEFDPMVAEPVTRIDTREDYEKEEREGDPCDCWKKLNISSDESDLSDRISLMEWAGGDLADCLENLGIDSNDPESRIKEVLEKWEARCGTGEMKNMGNTPKISEPVISGRGREEGFNAPNYPQPPVRPGVRRPFSPAIPDEDIQEEPLF